MGNCLELLFHPDRSSGSSRWWWSAPVTPPPLSQWSNLAPEVAGMVLHRLSAGGVDQGTGRTTARQASLFPPLPRLALPNGAAYSLDGKLFPFPHHRAGYTGVCGEWLVFRPNEGDGADQLVVVDPFSDATMTLPALSGVRTRPKMAVHSVICCSRDFVAAHVTLGDDCNGIAACKPGAASRWSVYLDRRVSVFDDYAFYQGKLYAVDFPGGTLFSIDIDQGTGNPWVSQIQQVIGGDTTFRGDTPQKEKKAFRGDDDYLGEMLYLVESCGGELLMVRRIINGPLNDAPRRNEFQVFKADLESSRWTEMTTIGDDQVLFLRQRCSKSVCVSQREKYGDRIFFLENVDEDQSYYHEKSPSRCSLYDMRKRNGNGTKALPVEVSWSPGTVSTWLFPKDSSGAVAVVQGSDQGKGHGRGYGRGGGEEEEDLDIGGYGRGRHVGHRRLSTARGRGPAPSSRAAGRTANKPAPAAGPTPTLTAGGGRVEKQPNNVDQGAHSMVNDQVMDEGDREVATAGTKVKTCNRCSQKGYMTTEGNNEIYCVLCDGHDHVNHRCPLLKLPKPVAHVVRYPVEGLGFYYIPHPPLSRKKESKTALVKVIGGSLSLAQVANQLQRIVPGKRKWEPMVHEKDSFVVHFPSKAELQRAIAYGGVDVHGGPTGVRLQFEEWHAEEEGFLLPKVWIRVTGLRKKLREYLNLWAIGTLLGSTQMVDMETTRKNNFGRIHVAVLDRKIIPSWLDVVIGDHYFVLKFEVEPIGTDENGEEVEWTFSEGDDHIDNDEDGTTPNGESTPQIEM